MFFDDGAAVEPTTGSALETKGEPRGGAGGEVGTGGAQGPSSESTNSRFKSAARRVVAANRSNKVEGGPVGGDASTSRELFPPEEVEAAASGDGAGGDDDGGDGGVSLAVALSGQTGPEAMKDANGNEMSHEEQNKRAKAAAAITGGSAKAKPSAAAPRMMPLRKYKLPALTDKAKILEQEKCLKVQIVCVRGRGKVWVQLYAREGCLGGCEGVWVQRNYAYTPPADLELKEKACTRIASLMRTRCLFRDSHPFVLPISLCPPRPRPTVVLRGRPTPSPVAPVAGGSKAITGEHRIDNPRVVEALVGLQSLLRVPCEAPLDQIHEPPVGALQSGRERLGTGQTLLTARVGDDARVA